MAYHLIGFLLIHLFLVSGSAYSALAGGRLNAFSEGQNAFAGVVNPANAVWLPDRFDVGAFWLYQKSSLTNRDNNPFFPPGKTNLTYRSRNIFTADAALHKQFKVPFGTRCVEYSLSLALYSLPAHVKLRTKVPFRLSGTTPLKVRYDTDALSAVFSVKLNACHSIGFAIDYLYLSHSRGGFQRSDNALRSVSPGHVTNNGMDHSSGFGLGVGYRWKISKSLDFGIAWTRKSYCGQYRKYRGFEPHHAHNYMPQTVGGGFTYRFTNRMAGRLELLWVNEGNIPYANNNLIDGKLNLNKRGSNRSPGPGLNDSTYINLGLGYQVNKMVSLGAGYSHRLRNGESPIILSHSYRLQAIYDILSLGMNLDYQKHNLFVSFSYGFKNKVSGNMPLEIGGGRFTGEKQICSLSLSWGYQY